MPDRLTDLIRHDGMVTATFEDAHGFFATVSITREDVAKLVRELAPETRFGSGMQPDTVLVSAAGAWLVRNKGYSADIIMALSDWQRIWTAESFGWDRRSVETVTF